MKTNLQTIATIQTGIFGKTETEGDVVYLQAKHFNEQGKLNSILHADLKQDNIAEKHLLRDGDVLFAAKGRKNFAAVFENHKEPAVASTSFFVIRLTDKSISPHYLVWFLNHSKTQELLKRQAIGTAIVSISKSVLEELEIFIPDLQTQKAVLKITDLRNKQNDLMRKIETLREKQIQVLLLNAINK